MTDAAMFGGEDMAGRGHPHLRRTGVPKVAHEFPRFAGSQPSRQGAGGLHLGSMIPHGSGDFGQGPPADLLRQWRRPGLVAVCAAERAKVRFAIAAGADPQHAHCSC